MLSRDLRYELTQFPLVIESSHQAPPNVNSLDLSVWSGFEWRQSYAPQTCCVSLMACVYVLLSVF